MYFHLLAQLIELICPLIFTTTIQIKLFRQAKLLGIYWSMHEIYLSNAFFTK